MKTPYWLLLFFTLSCAQAGPPDEMTGTPAPGLGSQPTEGDPTQGTREQARGFYSSGKLLNADLLPLEGPGLLKLFQPRDRGFGTYDLIYVLTEASRRMLALFPNARDRVQVGDLSGPKGGPISRHSSHQNGLDADVAFLRLNQTEQDPQATEGYAENFVVGNMVSTNFDSERNFAYAKALVETGRVQRIFVNAVIKRDLCDYAMRAGLFHQEAETLRRLRPYAGHEDHFHVRVTCPAASPSCKAQAELPPETGC